MRSIFFSYASEERESLAVFVSEFKRVGIGVLIDQDQIGTGGSIPEAINRMIALSDGAVLFFSTAYARKPWTTEEQNALLYRSIEQRDYDLAVVRLDAETLPPLLAHRLWADSGNVEALAKAFAQDVRAAVRGSNDEGEFRDWLLILREHELEALATAINNELAERPSSRTVLWRTSRLGTVSVHLIQPSVQRFKDNLAFVLRILQRIDFIRNRLRERIVLGGLGVFEGPFLLEEQDRLKQIYDFRQELRSTLDAMVDRLLLA